MVPALFAFPTNQLKKMTEENKEKPPITITEVLIATGVQMAKEQNMNLAELMGHFSLATLELYNRNILCKMYPPSEPSSDADKEKQVVSPLEKA